MWPFHDPQRRDEARRIKASQEFGDRTEQKWEKDIACWQIEHDAICMDMDVRQRQRWVLFIRACDAGIWSADLAFARWRVHHAAV